jgi:hypothetical protein
MELNDTPSVPLITATSNGITQVVLGFQTSIEENKYFLNFDLEESGPLVKYLANKFLDQAEDVEIKITEGENTLVWSGATIDSMFGFKSFSLRTKDKPLLA